MYTDFFALTLLLILYQHTFSTTYQKSLHAQTNTCVWVRFLLWFHLFIYEYKHLFSFGGCHHQTMSSQNSLHGWVLSIHRWTIYFDSTLCCVCLCVILSRFECVIKHFVSKWVFVNFDLCILSFRFSDRHICHLTFDLRSLCFHTNCKFIHILH